MSSASIVVDFTINTEKPRRRFWLMAETWKPAVADTAPDFLYPPPPATHTEQIAQKEHLEENCRIKNRATGVRTVQVFGLIVGETELDEIDDLTKEMIFVNQALGKDKFAFQLLGLKLHNMPIS